MKNKISANVLEVLYSQFIKFTLMLRYVFFSFLSFSCGSLTNLTAQGEEPVRPLESYSSEIETLDVSVVNIPVRIEAYELERAVNNRINGTLYEDYNYADGDGMMLKVMKSNWINVWFDASNNLYYRVPVSIWFKKNLGITEAETTGEIALKFKTSFSVKRDWMFETQTYVESYDWIQKPTLNAGWGIPVTSVANFAIDKNKVLLGQLIDKQVRESFDFKGFVSNAWSTVQNPSLLSQEYKAWMKVSPKNISMTPIYTKDNVFQTNIGLEAVTEVLIGKQPTSKGITPLPELNTLNNGLDKNDFLINLHLDIPYNEIDSMLVTVLKGQKFSQSGKTVVVESARLFGQENQVVVEVQMAGDFKGNLYLKGVPKYDVEKREIFMDQLDFELNTKNFFAKGANWLFHKGLVKLLSSNLHFPLGDKLDVMKLQFGESLKNHQIATGVSMQGSISGLDIQRVYLTSSSIRIGINAKGALNLIVRGLD